MLPGAEIAHVRVIRRWTVSIIETVRPTSATCARPAVPHPFHHVFPDQLLRVALGRLAGAPFLPVLDRTDPMHLLPDTLAAYDRSHALRPPARRLD